MLIDLSSEPDKVWEGLTVDEKIKTVLTAEIKRRLAPNEVKIKADFELTCYSFDGIECIKEALRAGEQFSNDVIHLKVAFYPDFRALMATNTSFNTIQLHYMLPGPVHLRRVRV